MGYQTTNSLYHSHLLILVKIHLLLLLRLVHGATNLAENATDLGALLRFKAQISDPLASLSSWSEINSSMHFCDWQGITCGSPEHPERITALNLASFNLSGTLSPYLANLTYIQILNLSNNSFQANIPSEFGSLSNLQYLDLSNNLLDGEIPLSLTHCTKLRNITLDVNSLSGQIPANFSNCRNLETISFYHNQLAGTIPASLGSLPNLHLLNLVRNQLTGGIPPSLGNLSSLSHLLLSTNNLGGRIPDEIGKLDHLELLAFAYDGLSGDILPKLFNISSLNYIHLAGNNFSGVLPHDMGISLPNLQSFFVYSNQLEGLLPAYLSNASALQYFVVDENNFVGEIPKNLGNLQNLTYFEVGNNHLSAKEPGGWDFLTSLTNCSNLDTLSLPQNNLQGILPSSVANLSAQLTWLDLAGNNISGTIPLGIGKYTSLTLLDLSLNHFSGIIPSTIGMFHEMSVLYLFGNRFHGEIPTSIGNLRQLTDLRLGKNELQGSIPLGIGSLSHLVTLDLSHNNLNGSIPGQALSQLYSLSLFLNLSHNSFTGPLPAEIGKLINLNVLDVSENKLSGEIPGSLGSCQLLGALFLQGNFFEGSIPSDLSSLKGIQQIDLSRNNLSGLIPEYFDSFRLLNYLNLSYNNLEGSVPQGGVFTKANAVSLLGNNNLCGGEQGLHLHPCDSTDRKSSHKSKGIKVIIPVLAASVSVILISAAYYIWKKRSKAEVPMPFLKEQFVQVSYAEIFKATNGFSSLNLIGTGSFGSVYKGILDANPKQAVAVKVLNLGKTGASKSFAAECNSLRVIRHRNLVSVVTVCSTFDHSGNDFKALVLDYMANGSLDEWLHPRVAKGSGSSRSLSLVQRLNIVLDVAFALDYLHHQCQTPIVHCDLKPSNVLLDHEMTAHVSDFGLSRFLHGMNSSLVSNSSVGIKGTIGYVAPEYGMGGSVTKRGDVYSYGVVLLEMFTGKRPTDDFFQNDLNLRKYVAAAYPDKLLDVLDPSIAVDEETKDKYSEGSAEELRGWMQEIIVAVFRVGLLCCKESANERIQMRDVVNELLLVKEALERLDLNVGGWRSDKGQTDRDQTEDAFIWGL